MRTRLWINFCEITKPLGIVFGDIGTSPIYTLTAVFLVMKPTEENIIGVISLIIWSLIIVVHGQYAWLAMNLSIRGEGGTIILQQLLTPLVKSKTQISIVLFLSFIALSFLIGDGVITPAITILSAVEGLVLIPVLAGISISHLLVIAVIITILLFTFQRRGIERLSTLFSPLMLVWFIVLALSGMVSLFHCPRILNALNPFSAFHFFIANKLLGFLALSEVILALTGGEALYADMGHMGKNSIKKAWYFVFACLVLNYLGQGAHLMLHPGTKLALFEMVLQESGILYIPFLILTVCATIIASQSMISAIFSIVYQAINTHIIPRLKVTHTSHKLLSQIYIGFANWFLFACVILMLFTFKQSSRMAVAYGLAVNVTMTMTALMLTWIYHQRKDRMLEFFSLLAACVDLLFLYTTIHKIPYGGYWSIIIAMMPLLVILIFRAGRHKLHQALHPLGLKKFLTLYEEFYQSGCRIKGTAVFLLMDSRKISPYMANVMFQHKIIYENNIILSVKTQSIPYGVKGHYTETFAPSLRGFEIKMGYMEIVDIEGMLQSQGIAIGENVIFYGIEDIVTDNPLWKVFAFIKTNSPSFVQFYDFPSKKLLGVITSVEL
ncbi:MAG: KUP/HAK/KT family potassium transporter [Candidatus Eremiobacteraeota bacterium]|nr:KUP/HAK/KT family potassium transporter [Candidatus Eremiobacteraeota bacterium]